MGLLGGSWLCVRHRGASGHQDIAGIVQLLARKVCGDKGGKEVKIHL